MLASIPGIPLWVGILLVLTGGIGCLFARRGVWRTLALVAAVAGVFVFFHPPLPDPKAMIVGAWKNGDGETLEFFADGNVITDGPKGHSSGKFSFPDSDHIKFDLTRSHDVETVLDPHGDGVAALVTHLEPAALVVASYSLSSNKLVIKTNDEESIYQRMTGQ
jgi:hypothetical protein